jgi:hypothetical protein
VPERASSRILMPGILLKRRLLFAELLVEDVLDDVGEPA